MSITANLIITAFDTMGGDPEGAVDSAQQYSDVRSWISSQSFRAGMAGAGAQLVPYVHLIAMGVDLGFLLHKMSYCCWGIGAIYDRPVLGKYDMAQILAVWSGAEDLKEIKTMYRKTTRAFLEKTTGKLGAKAGTKIGAKVAGKLGSKLGAKLGAKVASKVATKFAAKLAAKGLGGFVPVLGAYAGYKINRYFVNEISESAITYYSTVAVLEFDEEPELPRAVPEVGSLEHAFVDGVCFKCGCTEPAFEHFKWACKE